MDCKQHLQQSLECISQSHLTVSPVPGLRQSRLLAVPEETVLLLKTVDGDQPTSVQGTLLHGLGPAQAGLGEEIPVTILTLEVLPAREGPHRGEEEDGEEGGQHGD